jgi:anthranilate phosphoribosyltransferase
MFAPAMHPAMRHVGPVRRELGIPTVMNIVGPLANPAGAARQVVGVAERGRMALLAGALAALGAAHALVVHGEPGMDEISPMGPTHVAEVRDGAVTEWTIRPEDYGFAGFSASELAGGGPADNARTITDVLTGKGHPAARAAVVLNAAGALYAGKSVIRRVGCGRERGARERCRGRRAGTDAASLRFALGDAPLAAI